VVRRYTEEAQKAAAEFNQVQRRQADDPVRLTGDPLPLIGDGRL
jgi:hypothetical protein